MGRQIARLTMVVVTVCRSDIGDMIRVTDREYYVELIRVIEIPNMFRLTQGE